MDTPEDLAHVAARFQKLIKMAITLAMAIARVLARLTGLGISGLKSTEKKSEPVMANERIYFEGGPPVISVDGKNIRITITSIEDKAIYSFLTFPADDGLRVVKDIKACLYAIHAMEDEN